MPHIAILLSQWYWQSQSTDWLLQLVVHYFRTDFFPYQIETVRSEHTEAVQIVQCAAVGYVGIQCFQQKLFSGVELDMAKNVKVIQATSPILSAQSQLSVKKRRVAAYARVSTEKDEQQNSYEAQIEYYTRYIKGNPEWSFAGIYSDEGITGTSIKRRDGFNKMIEDALAGKIEIKTAELIQFDFSSAATF